jgi:hypothetical protein
MFLSTSVKTEVFSTPAISPIDGRKFDVLVPGYRIRRACELGEFAKIELLRIVPEVLLKPKAIYAGVKKLNDEKALAFVGQPEFVYEAGGEPFGPWTGPAIEAIVVLVSGDHILCDYFTGTREGMKSWDLLNWRPQFTRRVL